MRALRFWSSACSKWRSLVHSKRIGSPSFPFNRLEWDRRIYLVMQSRLTLTLCGSATSTRACALTFTPPQYLLNQSSLWQSWNTNRQFASRTKAALAKKKKIRTFFFFNFSFLLPLLLLLSFSLQLFLFLLYSNYKNVYWFEMQTKPAYSSNMILEHEHWFTLSSPYCCVSIQFETILLITPDNRRIKNKIKTNEQINKERILGEKKCVFRTNDKQNEYKSSDRMRTRIRKKGYVFVSLPIFAFFCCCWIEFTFFSVPSVWFSLTLFRPIFIFCFLIPINFRLSFSHLFLTCDNNIMNINLHPTKVNWNKKTK